MQKKRASETPPIDLPFSDAKLALPRVRAGVIPRARLFAALDRLESVELTVVSGPAGSGKTVLVSSWLAQRSDLSSAWVTLDPADDDPARLWTYIGRAVDLVRPGLALPALSRLRTPRPNVEAAIDELLNGLAGYKGHLALVLDDLHHVSADQCLRSIGYAAERLPPSTRLLATTRSDPGRRLGRLRARGALGELRAKDTAFTTAEAGELLVDRAGISVTVKDVELLVERTEGWPAGISLAALWLAEIDTPSEGIREFSANHRHVADYLTSEVLEAVDADTRHFLLRTSILDRFTPALCDAVLGGDDAAAVLADLERSNLFLIALDARGGWYRYHHLFGELLRLELDSTSPDELPDLHRRAEQWLLTNGYVEEAIKHAAAGGQDELAGLLTAEHSSLLRGGKAEVFVNALNLLPDEQLEKAPVLAAAGAMAGVFLGQPAANRRRLATIAEENRHHLPEPVQRYVEGLLLVIHAGTLDAGLDVALENARAAVALAREHADELAVPALAILAYTEYLRGDPRAARDAVHEALSREDALQRPHGIVIGNSVLALLENEAGHLLAAESQARQAVEQARQLGIAGLWSAGIAHHALGQALLALGRPHQAERELERAETLRRAPEPRLDHAHTLLVLAQARLARGRLTLAATELGAAREVLDAFTDAGRLTVLADQVMRELEEARLGSAPAVEPPSPAELAVLRLLASDLSQREIGEELFLSMNTVKTHTRNVYGKLHVNSREAAVRQANALGLIDSADSPG